MTAAAARPSRSTHQLPHAESGGEPRVGSASASRRRDLAVAVVFIVYLIGYTLFSGHAALYFPPYSYPAGDEATYYSYATRPWTLTSDFFAGYPPKETINPYSFRLFLAPFSLLFALAGFHVMAARWIVLAYGLIMLVLWYAIGRRLVPSWIALGVVIVASWAPRFWFHTHGVRPEGMLTLWMTLCLWIFLRPGREATPWNYAWVGLVSASGVWIHYNGVVLYPLFLLALMLYDRPHVTLRKLLAYGGAGLAFGVLFVFLNLLPARETLRDYGVLPVTFASSNQVPLLEGTGAIEHAQTALAYYSRAFTGQVAAAEGLPWGAIVFAGLSLIGVVVSRRREAVLLLGLLLALATAMILVLPNPRWEYTIYLMPPLVLLAMHGLAQLARGRWTSAVVAIVLLSVGIADMRTTLRCLQESEDYYLYNQRAGAILRELIQTIGRPAEVTVLASQEFHCFAADTRFRTFHSLIETGDVGETLRLIDPDIVVLHPRGMVAMGTFLAHAEEQGSAGSATEAPAREEKQRTMVADPRTGQLGISLAAVESMTLPALREAGYAKIFVPKRRKLTWNGGPVAIYVKKKDGELPKRVGQRPAEMRRSSSNCWSL